MQISTQETFIQPRESTILLIKQMARMYKTLPHCSLPTFCISTLTLR